MSKINLYLDLSPLPAVGPDRVRFGLHVFGAFDAEADAKPRLDALVADLAANPVPERPDDASWTAVEGAFGNHLGELLPWLWTQSQVQLVAAGRALPAPRILLGSEMHRDSLDVARRGYLYSMYRGSGQLADPKKFSDARVDSGTRFSVLSLTAQATRWPSPVPQEGLRTVWVMELDRGPLQAVLDADPQALVGALLSFGVGANVYPQPDPLPAFAREGAHWEIAAGADTVSFNCTSLRLDQVLNPPVNPASFVQPTASLWLRNGIDQMPVPLPGEVAPGDPMSDHDWWSRLHDGVSSAVEAPRLIVESLKKDPSGPSHREFPRWALALSGALRDILEPGIACAGPALAEMFDHPRAPLIISLLSAWRDAKLAAPPDLLAIAKDRRWPDFAVDPMPADDLGRIALVYCALQREAFQAPSLDDWYVQLRTWSEQLAKILPEVQSASTPLATLTAAMEVLSAQERLAWVDALRIEALRPAVRARALSWGWQQAVLMREGDTPQLAAAKTAASPVLRGLSVPMMEAAFLKDDPAAMVMATAALGATRSASKSRAGEDRTVRFASKIEAAALEHARARLSPDPIQRPSLGIAAADLIGLEEAAHDNAEEAHRWIFARASVDATGNPSPLVLQIDNLNDASDDDAGEVDFNLWLNGYAAFFRRAAPAAAVSEWGCGQLGLIEARMWPDAPLLLDTASRPLLSAAPSPAAVNYGVRQVLMQHDNRPTLPDAGIDLVGQTHDGSANEWSDSGGFVVVADRANAAGAGSRTQLPFVAFGIDYEAVVWAESRCGVPPAELSGAHAAGAPYLLDAHVDLTALLHGSPNVRALAYRRQVPVSRPRVTVTLAPSLGGNHPVGWSPLSVSDHLHLAHSAWPMPLEGNADAAPVCVLVSAQGLDPAEQVPTTWKQVGLSLMPPSCTWPVYDRWVGYDHATSDTAARKSAWARWRSRIQSSELLVSATKRGGKPEDWVGLNEQLADPRALLDDPAVTSLVVEWRPLRSDSTASEYHDIRFPRLTDPPVPLPVDDTDPEHQTVLLHERGRAGPDDWSVAVRVDETGTAGHRSPRFSEDLATRTLVVSLWPGEIGDLCVHSAVTMLDVRARCLLEPKQELDGLGLFGAWSCRFEVATAHQLTPQDLFDACYTRVSPAGDVALLWKPEKSTSALPLSPDMLAIDNIGTAASRRQVWHGTGRHLASFPHGARSLDALEPVYEFEDDSVDPSASGTVWDAQGFTGRYFSSAMRGTPAVLNLNRAETVIHEERASPDGDPRYLRFAVEAMHRYADLYRPMITQASNLRRFVPLLGRQAKVIGDSKYADEWIRAFRFGSDPVSVARPAVRLIVPLTRSIDSTPGSVSADILLVLDEELNTTSPLATRLEAVVEQAYRKYVGAGPDDFVEETAPEASPDPILGGRSETRERLALDCVGPLGHTFDTDTREPYFAGVSYVLRSSAQLKDWHFAKLAFRRMLVPEVMTGYYPPPALEYPRQRVVTRPTSSPIQLAGVDLAQSLQGHLSLQGLSDESPTISIEVAFFDERAVLELRHSDEVIERVRRSWALRGTTLPVGAILDKDWSAQQAWKNKPSSKVCKADLRVFVARIREANPEGKTPARWELALYVAVSTRAPWAELNGDESLPWERRWVRVMTWERDEPSNILGSSVSLRADAPAEHGVAQAAVRTSGYTPAEWVQALPDAASLPIAGTPWVTRAPADAPLTLRLSNPAAWELSLHQGERPAALNWRPTAVAAGEEGQGLYHRLLVTKIVKTADGNHSEAYVGIFNQATAGENRFVRVEPALLPAAPPAAELRAYVLLMQNSLRDNSGATVLGFWKGAFPDQDDDPMKSTDARHRILGISEPIDGAG